MFHNAKKVLLSGLIVATTVLPGLAMDKMADGKMASTKVSSSKMHSSKMNAGRIMGDKMMDGKMSGHKMEHHTAIGGSKGMEAMLLKHMSASEKKTYQGMSAAEKVLFLKTASMCRDENMHKMHHDKM